MTFRRLPSVLALLAACVVLSTAPAAAQKITIPAGEWTGTYYYDEIDANQQRRRRPVDFVVILNVAGDSFSGKVKEPRTFGQAGSDFLFAEMLGRVNGSDMSFVFMKKYDGTSGVTHTVFYQGKIDPRTLRVEGEWSIDKATGAFHMSPKR